MSNNKVAIIGLDGAGLNLIKPWARAGFLPNFKKILDGGISGKLESVIPPLTAPAWTALYTGKNAGKHGIFDFIGLRPDSYDIIPTSFADNRAQTFWEIVGSFGKRVGILNTPFTYPLKKINGIMVSGLQTPPQAEDFTYPEEIKQEMDELVGKYPIYPIEFNGDRDTYLKSLHDVTEKQFKVFFHYFRQLNWDLFMCVFQTTDAIQHHFWQFMDNTHPYYQKGNKYEDAIRQLYQKIDTYLGQFIKYLDKQTTLIIVSDHGCSPLYKYVYINNWLYKWGMIKFKQTPKVWLKKLGFSLNFTPLDIYNFLFSRKNRLLKTKGKVRHFFSFKQIDWKRTKAFSFSSAGLIFVNLKGRQAQGCVEPGEEYERVCDEIVRRLYEIKDPETGEQIIEQAYKRSQIYFGKYISCLPDIFYFHKEDKYTNRGGNKFYSNKLIEKCPRKNVSGAHGLEGIALFYGNGINRNQKIENLKLQDIAPIVLAILGLDIPEDMDGKVKSGIFHSGFLKELKFSSVKKHAQRDKYDYSPEESKAIERRLRDLGYLD